MIEYTRHREFALGLNFLLPKRQSNPMDRSREMGRNAYSSEPHGRLAIGNAEMRAGFSCGCDPAMGG